MNGFIVIVIILLVVFTIYYFLFIRYNKYNTYDIVYKPLSDRYYPRCNGYYIFEWSSGRWTLESSIEGCRYSFSTKGAKRIIEKYKESLGVYDQIIKIEDK